ncbi:helix-turn-helix transcriptional regulator [Marininema halotolerans]|uniref:GAF domain-containing protein n=1 Tax=Marininema halotolerans TaxID=1155944 RepID=A0A1I6NR52_9BACL|nr:LuxR C-terminal-related transcriptional regulator [Marininema halotolerans]SFS30360.1 GAF domain-containing protein [Marininema halotolerans]
MQPAVYFDIPMLPRKEIQTIIDTISQGYSDILIHWNIKLSTITLDDKQRKSLNDIFLRLIHNLRLFPNQSKEYHDKFLRLVKKSQPTLHPSLISFTLGIFEEILIGLFPRTSTGDWIGFRWIHSLVFSLLISYSNSSITTEDRSPDVTKESASFTTTEITPSDSFMDKIVQFDTLLLGAHSLEDVMRLTVHRIVEAIGYKRSALFWYSPITRTVEGTHAYHVDITDLRRIRSFEANIPGMTWMIRQNRPLYIQDACLYIPDHFIKHFHLQSLLVATLQVDQHQPVGFLLIDQGGKPFAPSTEELNLLEKLTSRVSVALRPKLYEYPTLSAHPPASPVLTHREQEILQMIAYGYSTRHIGETLHISEHTVAEHAQGILKKLNSKNRSEAVAKGLRLGLIH